MCTAVSYQGKHSHYFGRNLDLEYTFREQVTVTPRNYPFRLRSGYVLEHHYAMIGMATIAQDYPLYYEATNERGLSIAGLNFPNHAAYLPKSSGKDNVAPYELIPWILGQCATVSEAQQLLGKIQIWNLPFSREFSLTPLHWIIADAEKSIVAEPMADGLRIYENPLGILTNSPPFTFHLDRLSEFMNLSPKQPVDRSWCCQCKPYSNGLGATGLPGDYSSSSRFIRAAFVKEHSVTDGNDISQFFHILSSVAMPRGSVKVAQENEITQYTSCCDTQNGIYYYRTYGNSRITGIQLKNCALLESSLITWPLRKTLDIRLEN